MKNQALFSSKYKSKKLKCRLLQFLFGTLRVNEQNRHFEACGTADKLIRDCKIDKEKQN